MTETTFRYFLVRQNDDDGWELPDEIEEVYSKENKPDFIEVVWLSSPDIATHICSATRMAAIYRVTTRPIWSKEVDSEIIETVQDWIDEQLRICEVPDFDYTDFNRFWEGLEKDEIEVLDKKGLTRMLFVREATDGEDFDSLLESVKNNELL